MSEVETSWTLIRGAAKGDKGSQKRFYARYETVIRSTLTAMWHGLKPMPDIDDAAQEVLTECLKKEGVLSKADPERGSFRGYLYKTTVNVAMRFGDRRKRKLQQHQNQPPDENYFDTLAKEEPSAASEFHCKWKQMIVRNALELLIKEAEQDPEILQRMQLLQLLHVEEKKWEEIVDLHPEWVNGSGKPKAQLKAMHRRAQKEFMEAIRKVIGIHSPGTPADIQREYDILFPNTK